MHLKSPTTQYCAFTQLENHIWEFRFLKANNQAVDEWVAWQNYLKNTQPIPDKTPVRMLLDFRPDGPMSTMYALQKTSEWRRQNQDIEPVPVRIAIVLKSLNRFQKGYAEILKEGVNVFGMHKVVVEIFPDAYQPALDWLSKT